MHTEIRERLEKGGIDVSGALERFMGNEELLERFLKKLLTDTNYEKLISAVETGDQEAALNAAHTLKGISGNLSIMGLYKLLSRQVADFRAEDWEKGIALMPDIIKEYEAAVAAIRSLE
ncbi:MAG: Hpt domain-containing protein [Clostridiales bacterium]|nr:Hpt domain-containing protein [Clostridiales bacterium]